MACKIPFEVCQKTWETCLALAQSTAFGRNPTHLITQSTLSPQWCVVLVASETYVEILFLGNHIYVSDARDGDEFSHIPVVMSKRLLLHHYPSKYSMRSLSVLQCIYLNISSFLLEHMSCFFEESAMCCIPAQSIHLSIHL